MSDPNAKHPSSIQPRLLDQVRAKIRMKHYSRRTEDAYIHWIRRFILFHDKRHPTMFKTIEIVVDNRPCQVDVKKVPKHKIMDVRIAVGEIELRRKVKEAGGKWDPKRKVWQLPYEKVTELGLSDRIIDEAI